MSSGTEPRMLGVRDAGAGKEWGDGARGIDVVGGYGSGCAGSSLATLDLLRLSDRILYPVVVISVAKVVVAAFVAVDVAERGTGVCLFGNASRREWCGQILGRGLRDREGPERMQVWLQTRGQWGGRHVQIHSQ